MKVYAGAIMIMRYRAAIYGWMIVAVLTGPVPAYSAMLLIVSDTIETSRPSIESDHTIRFKTYTAIPASGRLVVTPQTGVFDIPDAFDYTDVDLLVATSSQQYVQRALSESTSAATSSVSVASGKNGSIEIALSEGEGIDAGIFVEVRLGRNAEHGAAGNERIINPAATGSYKVRIATYNAIGAKIEEASAMVAVVRPVGINVSFFDSDPPVIANGLPAGDIPMGTTRAEISVDTDEIATCRYATTTDTAFASMPNGFVRANTIFHSALVSGLGNGNVYTYHVRCQDTHGNSNQSDFTFSFSPKIEIGPQPPSPPPQSSGGGGGGGGGTGNGQPFPPAPIAAQLTVKGVAYGGSEVIIKRDDREEKQVNADAQGNFSAQFIDLTQGTHAFAIKAKDRDGVVSATKTVTASVVSGSVSSVRVILPPTIAVKTDIVKRGELLMITGESIPGGDVEVMITPQKNSSGNDTMTADGLMQDGNRWKLEYDTSKLAVASYVFRARARLSKTEVSDFSKTLFVGVGQKPLADLGNRSDINKDEKVNLVDFSILLYHWGKPDDDADINMSGKIDLADFSIMLFNWTG